MLDDLGNAVFDAFIAPIWNIAKVIIAIGIAISIIFVLFSNEFEGPEKITALAVIVFVAFMIFAGLPIILKIGGTIVFIIVIALIIALVDH